MTHQQHRAHRAASRTLPPRGGGQRGGQAGFTLIEVLISLGILAFMMAIAWSTTSSGAQARRHFEAFEERNHEIRTALGRMATDLSMAYLSANEDQNRTERRTIFLGKSSGRVNELRFSSFGHVTLWADANEADTTMISYYGAADPEHRGQTNLVRRAQRRLSNENHTQEPAEIDVLLRDVERVEFEYYDWRDNEWKSSWDSTGADSQRNRPPTRVRVQVTVKNGSGAEVTYTTQARIMMQEMLRFHVN
jgi:general secretion pathway protein J